MMRPHLLLLLFSFSAGLGWACSGGRDKNKEASGAVAGPTRRLALVVDVPAVVGASIDELQRQFGPVQPLPAHLADPAALASIHPNDGFDSAGTFQRRGVTLVATFNTNTRQVSDLLVLGKNEQTVIQQANLDIDSPKYLLLPVYDTHNTSRFIGLRVVARQAAE